MKWKIFACKYPSTFPRSRKLEIQNSSADLKGVGCRAIFKWDKAKAILSMTHAQTQTVCVTHVVSHCCPPALLTQLYTSVMGLGAKTAGRRPSPHQTIGGAPLLCVGGLGAWIGLWNTADISEHWAPSCVSVSRKATTFAYLIRIPRNLDIAPRSRTF